MKVYILVNNKNKQHNRLSLGMIISYRNEKDFILKKWGGGVL